MGDSGDQSLVGGLGGAAGVRALSVEGVLRSAQHPLLDLRVDGSLRVVRHVVRQELHVLGMRLFLPSLGFGVFITIIINFLFITLTCKS